MATIETTEIKEERLKLVTDGNGNYRWETTYHASPMVSPTFTSQQLAWNWFNNASSATRPYTPSAGWSVVQ